jgi:hypothetical protein
MNSIDFQAIITMLKIIPKKYRSNTVKVAKGKYKLPTTIKEAIKKVSNG